MNHALTPNDALNPKPANGHGLTQRELILELREDVKEVKRSVDGLESWKDRVDGRMDLMVRGVPILAAIVAIVSTGVTILALGSA